MLPVVAIVGRPNVGKSTLFNALTRSREALVIDLPGVTRDRQYGEGSFEEKPFIVIDTGGLEKTDAKGLEAQMVAQSWLAVQEADIVFFMVDARAGLLPNDEWIAKQLRALKKSVFLVVNKTDGLNADVAVGDFFQLGMGKPIPIAASHNRGISKLLENAFPPSPIKHDENVEVASEPESALETKQDIKIAIVGRPNVGKSTLFNRILGEERVIVFDEPGTTRDSIYIPFERQAEHYTIIDTAGMRRRARVHETVEKFSVVKTLQAIEASDVVILVLDAQAGVTEQDLSLIGFVIEAGRALVLAMNKWDGLPLDQRKSIKESLSYRLSFADFAKIHFISALHGTGVGNLFSSVKTAYRSATKKLPTTVLTRILSEAVTQHAPPMVQGRRIKLRYAHAGGQKPPVIIIHGNQTEHVPLSYKRYLINLFRKVLKLEGTPLRIEFKTGDNPFAGKRNILTPRQLHKRERLRKKFG